MISLARSYFQVDYRGGRHGRPAVFSDIHCLGVRFARTVSVDDRCGAEVRLAMSSHSVSHLDRCAVSK